MEKNLNDFIIDILQNIDEIQSIMKVLKDSIHNENGEVAMSDIENVLEIAIAKVSNTRNSLTKYIDTVF